MIRQISGNLFIEESELMPHSIYGAKCVCYNPFSLLEGICSLDGTAVSRDGGCNDPKISLDCIEKKTK